MLAFAHLNLRYNPFGAMSLERMGELAQVDTERYIGLLRPERAAVQFVGDKGFGKTTRLQALRRALSGAVYVRIPVGARVAIPAGRRCWWTNPKTSVGGNAADCSRVRDDWCWERTLITLRNSVDTGESLRRSRSNTKRPPMCCTD